MRKIVYLTTIIALLSGCSEMEIKWVKKFDAPGPGNYRINDIAGTYITGSFWAADSGPQCFTAKYDDAGELEWYKILELNNLKTAEGKSISALIGKVGILEKSKGIYVHAQITDSTDFRRSALMRYDPFGNIGWEKIVDCPADENELESVMLSDYSGNVYIAGLRSKTDETLNIFIAKFNQSGEKIWATNYYNPGLYLSNVRFDVKKEDQIVVGGVLEASRDFFFIRYDSAGEFLSLKRHETPEQESLLTDIKIDPEGNVYITGISYGGETGYDYLTIVYSNNDSLLWTKHFDGPAHMDDIAKAIAVAYHFAGFSENNDIANIKHPAVYDSEATNLFHVYVTGYSTSKEGNTDICTIKYDRKGNEVWTKKFIGKPGESAEPSGIHPNYLYIKYIHDTPTFYITGHVGNDMLLLKYNTSGFLSWFTRYGSKGRKNRTTACAKKYIAVESVSERGHEAFLLKYGEAAQLGIIRWD
jgi:hypothetical protein